MCVIYILSGIVVILLNVSKLPEVFRLIFTEAFSFRQVGAGFMGYTITMGMRYGFARGIFSNEAGLGSAPMAHGSSNNRNPVDQGLWGIFEVLIDTFFVCSITGIIAVMNLDLASKGFNGAALTSEAFRIHFPGSVGSILLTISLILFAFTTFVGWSHYGAVSLGYLTKNNKAADMVFKILFLIVGVVGATSELNLVWGIADTLNGLMAIPNLIGILILSPVIAKLTREFLKDPHSIDMKD